MENNNLVSIIMPCHNSENYIADAIISVQNQTYIDWELLIIDDCSTDNTISIINKFVIYDKRIKLLHTDKCLGKPFYPRNIGIKNATGKYIAFLDSDDIWLPTKLEHQISLMNNNNTAIVFSYYEKFSSENSDIYKNRVIKSPEIVTYKSALFGNPIGNLTGMYDTQKVGKIYYEDAGHEDYILWLTILKMGYIARNTKTIEARYRVAEKSVSSNKRTAALWTWKIYRETLKYNVIKSAFYYTIYMIKGIIKYMK